MATQSPPNPYTRQTPGGTAPRPPGRPGITRSWLWFALGLLLLNVIVANVIPSGGGTKRVTIPYTTFKQQVAADNVESVTVTTDSIDGHAKKAVSAPGSSDSSVDFHTVVPTFVGTAGIGTAGDNLEALLEQHHVQVTAQQPSQNVLLTILLSFGPTILLIGGFILLSRAAARATGGGGIMGFGRSAGVRRRATGHDVRRRGGDRRRQGGARRGRRLPA